MGLLRDTDALLSSRAPIENGMLPDEGNSFSRGFDQGTSEASGQLRALLARGAETIGATEFAKEQYAKAKEAGMEAAASAPAIDEVGKIKGLRDLGSYLAGQTGRMAPTLSAALAGAALTRGAAPSLTGGAFLGATAGTIPLTTGAEIQRQEANPATANMSLTDRNLSALGTGAAQAAISNVVPVAMGGKLMGQFAKQGGTAAERVLAAQAAKEAAGKNIVARNLSEGIAGNAAAGAAGEYVNQVADTHYDPNRDNSEDNQKMIDAGVTGAVTGIPFAGAGMLGDRIHGTRPVDTPKVDGAMPSAMDKLKSFMGGDIADVERPDSKAPIDLTPQDEINTLFDPPKKDKATDILRAESEGKPIEAELPPDATPESAAMADAAKRQEHDTELFRTANDIVEQGNASPELKAMYEQMEKQGRSTLDDPDFRQKLSTELIRHQEENDAIEKANAAIAELGDEGKYSVSKDVKAARDKELAPLLIRHINDFAARSPEVQTAMSEALMRIARRAAADGELPDPIVKYMDSITDGKGSSLLASIASDSFAGDDRDRIFRAANRMMSEERRMTGLQNTLMGALPDEIRSQYSTEDIRDLASRIRRLVGEVGTSKDTSAQAEYNKSILYDKMRQTFGDKYDTVIEAFAKDASDRAAETRLTPADRTDTTRAAEDTRTKENGGDEDGLTILDESNPWDKQPTHDEDGKPIEYQDKPIYYGNSKDAERPLIMTDEAHKANYPNDVEGIQTRRMRQAEEDAKSNGRTVSWMTAKEYALENGIPKNRLLEMTDGKPDAYGIVVAERTRSEEKLSAEDVSNMRVGDYRSGERRAAKTSYYNNPTTFHVKVGEKKIAFDGSRVASFMARKGGKALRHTEMDDTFGNTYRTARSFVEGIAALSDHFGTRIDPPDNTAIVNSKDRYMSYGDAKEIMKLANHPDKAVAAKLIGLYTEKAKLVHDNIRAEKEMHKDGPSAGIYASLVAKTEADIADIETKMDAVKNSDSDQVMKLKSRMSMLREQLKGETDPKVRDGIATELHTLDGQIGTEPLYKRRDRIIKALDSAKDENEARALERDLINIDKRIKDANLGEYAEIGTRSDMRDYKEGKSDGSISAWRIKRDDIARKKAQLTTELATAKKEAQSPVTSIREAATEKIAKLTGDIDELNERTKELEVRPPRTDDDNGAGVREIAPEAEIHLAVKDLGEKGVERKVDFSGIPLDYTRKPREPMSQKARKRNIDILTDEALFLKLPDTDDAGELAQTVYDLSRDKSLKNEELAPIIKAANDRIRELVFRDGTIRYDIQREHPANSASKIIEKIFSDEIAKGDSRFNIYALERMANNLREALMSDDPEPPVLTWNREKKERDDRLAKLDRLVGDQQRSSMRTGNGTATQAERDTVRRYIDEVLGGSVDLVWSRSVGSAGLFDREGRTAAGRPLIELSVHALNPITVAYHEAMHGFMHSLMIHGLPEVRQSLQKAANSPVVMSQLRKLLKDEPGALRAILDDPEERVAYMHQFWADNKLTLGGEARGIFQKITDTIKDILGIWSNDKRAEMIMEYFQTGEYARSMGTRSVASRALLERGTNRAVNTIMRSEVARALGNLSDAVVGIGGQRIRDMNIPSLTKIAELVRSRSIDSNADVGYITASGTERRRRINGLMDKLYDATPEQVTSAFNKMQLQDMNRTPLERQIIRHIQSTFQETRQYMRAAGVDVGTRDGGMGKEYTPVMWDMAKVADNQEAVLNMLRKYRNHPDMPATPEQILATLMRNEGSELDATIVPGNQHIKRRELWFIAPADRQPYIETDPYKIINSYISQATKRAEWARRFGDDNSKLNALREEALNDGATNEQLDVLDKYISGITGVLGSDVSPNWRKLSANMMVYQNVRLLALGVFSAAVDPLGLMVNGGTMKDAGRAFIQGVKDIPRGFKEMPIADARYKLAEDMGTIESAVLQHRLGASFGGMNAAGGFSRRVNEGLFKYNLMEQFNTSMRVAATEAAMKFLARHSEGDADRHSMRRLHELGLQPSDILMENGRPLVRASEFIARGYTAKEAQAASNKMAMAVNKWVDGAVLRPDASQKAIWMNDPHFAIIAHMKQFAFAFQETMLKRVAHEIEHGNYDAALGMASYVPVMLAADLTKGMIQGGGAQPEWRDKWDMGDYMGSALQRAGLFGVSQFGIDTVKEIRNRGTGLGTLGPTVGQLADAVGAVGGHGEFTSVGINALPANTLWRDWMSAGNHSVSPLEPIAE